VALIAKPALFAASGMYRNIWRYASLQDACGLGPALSAGRESGSTEVLQMLKELVPEFAPRYNFEVAPPVAFQLVRSDLFPPQMQSQNQKLSFVRTLRVAAQSEGSAA
jgi:hypothetical protein